MRLTPAWGTWAGARKHHALPCLYGTTAPPLNQISGSNADTAAPNVRCTKQFACTKQMLYDSWVTTSTLAPTTAADLLAALRIVVKRLQHTPMPVDAHTQAAWKQSPPAPRHVAALMQIVADERMSVSTLAARLGVSLAT